MSLPNGAKAWAVSGWIGIRCGRATGPDATCRCARLTGRGRVRRAGRGLVLLGQGVVTGGDRARAAEPVQQLVRGDEGRRAVEPGVEMAVEERVRAAVDERHDRRTPRAEPEVRNRAEQALARKGLPDQLFQLQGFEDLHPTPPSTSVRQSSNSRSRLLRLLRMRDGLRGSRSNLVTLRTMTRRRG